MLDDILAMKGENLAQKRPIPMLQRITSNSNIEWFCWIKGVPLRNKYYQYRVGDLVGFCLKEIRSWHRIQDTNIAFFWSFLQRVNSYDEQNFKTIYHRLSEIYKLKITKIILPRYTSENDRNLSKTLIWHPKWLPFFISKKKDAIFSIIYYVVFNNKKYVNWTKFRFFFRLFRYSLNNSTFHTTCLSE